MPRLLPPGHSRFGRETAWRAAFDLTETQSELVVALLAARQLGYDGATAEELAGIGIALNALSDMASLARMRLVECVGFTEERHPRKIWSATQTAARRFDVGLPVAPGYVETVEGRAAWADERAAECRKRRDRMRRGAA